MSEAPRNSPHHPENHAKVEHTLKSIAAQFPGLMSALDLLNPEDKAVLAARLVPAKAEPEAE